MDDLEKMIEDCKVYIKAMGRLKVFGVSNDGEAVVLLERECEEYREKIEDLQKAVDELRNPVFVPCQELQIDNLVDLPEDMRDRVYMMDVNKDGSITLYFVMEDGE